MSTSFRLLVALTTFASACGTAFVARAQSFVAHGDVTIEGVTRKGQAASTDPGALPLGNIVGEHTLAPAGGGDSRLRFVLLRSHPSTVPSVDADEPQGVKAVDHYLFDVIRGVDRDRLHDLVAVDQLVTRASEDTKTIELEHAIEVQGPEDSLRRVIAKLDAFVAANRGLITVSITAAKKSNPRVSGTAEVSLLDETAYAAMRLALNTSSREVLCAPTLMVYGGQRGDISTLEDTSYIADFTVTVADGALIADPVIKTLHEGLRFTVTPIVDIDGEHVHLAVETWIGLVRRPIREFRTTLAEGATPVTLQLPETVETRWKSDLLTLSRDERAVHVDGIHFVDFDEKKGEIPQELELLIEIQRATASPDGDAQRFNGMVIGVDSSNLSVFVACRDSSGNATTIHANQISIYRGNDPVGECRLVENLGGVLVFKLVKGEARAGDFAK